MIWDKSSVTALRRLKVFHTMSELELTAAKSPDALAVHARRVLAERLIATAKTRIGTAMQLDPGDIAYEEIPASTGTGKSLAARWLPASRVIELLGGPLDGAERDLAAWSWEAFWMSDLAIPYIPVGVPGESTFMPGSQTSPTPSPGLTVINPAQLYRLHGFNSETRHVVFSVYRKV